MLVAALQFGDPPDKSAQPRDHLRGIIDICNKPAGMGIYHLAASVAFLTLQPIQNELLIIMFLTPMISKAGIESNLL